MDGEAALVAWSHPDFSGLEKLWVAEHCPQRVDLSALDLAKMIIRL